MSLRSENDTSQNWASVADHLARNGLIFDVDGGAKQFSGGAANLNFLLTINNKKVVLRRPPSGPLAAGANDIAREFKVLSNLNALYSYAPKAIHYCDDLSVIGVPFCVSEFREGVPIQMVLPDKIATIPKIGRQLGRITLDALAKLHNVDPVAADLQTIGRADGFIERQVEGWFKRGARVLNTAEAQNSAAITDWLRQNLPEPQPGCIIHNDFKLDNILVDLDTLAVNAVLDWDMCTLGDPLYDLTILLLYWGQLQDPPVYQEQALMPYTIDGWMSRREALGYYYTLTSRTIDDGALKFYWVLALHRMAVVKAQLLALYTAGQLRSDRINERNANHVRQDISNILGETASLCAGDLQW